MTPGMLRPGHVIGLLRRRRRGRDREGVAAFLDRELLQGRQVVRRHADDSRSGLLEFLGSVAERVRLKGAALGERLREEIEHDRAFAQLLRQMDLERLAGQSSGGCEVGRLRPVGKRGPGRRCDQGGDAKSEQQHPHSDFPSKFRLGSRPLTGKPEAHMLKAGGNAMRPLVVLSILFAAASCASRERRIVRSPPSTTARGRASGRFARSPPPRRRLRAMGRKCRTRMPARCRTEQS